MDRIVSWFSCGAASAVATKMAIQKYGKDRVVVARCLVKEEHEDNDRFAADCETWFGVKIVNLVAEKYDGSIYEVFRQRKYISGVGGAPCTLLLKKAVREAFQLPTDIHCFGYCAEEQGRWDDFLDANNIDAIAPLIEDGVSHDDCLAILQRAGITLPTMYLLGFQHNNCIGCAKATGAGYWNKIRTHFPLQFNRMAVVSRAMGVRMTREGERRIFLDELKPGTGRYEDEPEIQCGIFCEMVSNDFASATQQANTEQSE